MFQVNTVPFQFSMTPYHQKYHPSNGFPQVLAQNTLKQPQRRLPLPSISRVLRHLSCHRPFRSVFFSFQRRPRRVSTNVSIKYRIYREGHFGTLISHTLPDLDICGLEGGILAPLGFLYIYIYFFDMVELGKRIQISLRVKWGDRFDFFYPTSDCWES